ncbi:MAG: hypothetical protein HUN04_02725 [Desulfobacter sp.]|nr:MAG: hypothetical protein HUN04_02725 [Desulfobacter sp.]
MPKNKKQEQELLEKQISRHERACEGIDTYQHFKKLDYWTLDEGVKLLIAPNEIGQKSKSMFPLLFDIEFLQNPERYQKVTRAINKSLPVEGNYEEKRIEYKSGDAKKTVSTHWYHCCARLKVNPFEFLEFVNDKQLFDIPDKLQFLKVRLDSGKYLYSWQDEVLENPDSFNHLNCDESAKLSGKESQELGRLRTEKRTMDATVKAAIEVGKFVQTKINNKEKIVRGHIENFVNKLDKNIPGTRIDLIWESINDEVKNGPGRPKKAKS